MKYCGNCGKEIDNAAVICPHCGMAQGKVQDVTDSGSIGWTVLGCCIPLVGLILFLVWKDQKPDTAKEGRNRSVDFSCCNSIVLCSVICFWNGS